MKFTLRELLGLTLAVAILLGAWLNYHRGWKKLHPSLPPHAWSPSQHNALPEGRILVIARTFEAARGESVRTAAADVIEVPYGPEELLDSVVTLKFVPSPADHWLPSSPKPIAAGETFLVLGDISSGTLKSLSGQGMLARKWPLPLRDEAVRADADELFALLGEFETLDLDERESFVTDKLHSARGRLAVAWAVETLERCQTTAPELLTTVFDSADTPTERLLYIDALLDNAPNSPWERSDERVAFLRRIAHEALPEKTDKNRSHAISMVAQARFTPSNLDTNAIDLILTTLENETLCHDAKFSLLTTLLDANKSQDAQVVAFPLARWQRVVETLDDEVLRTKAASVTELVTNPVKPSTANY